MEEVIKEPPWDRHRDPERRLREFSKLGEEVRWFVDPGEVRPEQCEAMLRIMERLITGLRFKRPPPRQQSLTSQLHKNPSCDGVSHFPPNAEILARTNWNLLCSESLNDTEWFHLLDSIVELRRFVENLQQKTPRLDLPGDTADPLWCAAPKTIELHTPRGWGL